MMGRIRLTRLILISFFSLLVIQILIVGIFGKFSALEFRQREKESVDYILSMYSRNMEGALEKTDNDLEDILLSNSTLMFRKKTVKKFFLNISKWIYSRFQEHICISTISIPSSFLRMRDIRKHGSNHIPPHFL